MTIYDPWRDLVTEPVSRDHFVQVYRDERALLSVVSLFAGAALGRNEAVLLIATRAHASAIEQRLDDEGIEARALVSWGQLTVLDAEVALSLFAADGRLDEAAFKAGTRDLIGSIKGRSRFRNVRVYGEMVDLLWAKDPLAAARCDELWNEMIEELSISLFCAYGLDAPGRPQRVLPQRLQALHTHFIPVEACA